MNKAKKSNIEAQANWGKEAGFKGLLLNRTNKRGFNNY